MTQGHKEKLFGILGGVLFASLALKDFGIFRESTDPYFFLIGLRALLVTGLYFTRTPAKLRARHWQTASSLLLSSAPLFYTSDINVPPLLPLAWAWSLLVAGNLLATWGIASLGSSFGIGPAFRKLVSHGPYRYLKHPIYTGYVICELGFLFMYPNERNAFVFAVAVLSYFIRARLENRIIQVAADQLK